MMCMVIKLKFDNEVRLYAIYNLIGCFGAVIGMLLTILLKDVDIIVLLTILSVA